MFDEFCREKQIKSNYKEALYHHLMEKYAEQDNPMLVIDRLNREEYETEWKVFLSQILEKFNRA